PREVLGEALRNLWTGVGRPLALAGAFALLVGGISFFDARVLVDANQKVAAWRDSGASITIVHAERSIDGAACDALAGVAGISGAGAGRTRPDGLPLPALPLGSPTFAEVTPGFARLIATAASGSATPGAATRDSLDQGGLLLSEALAKTLDRGPGTDLDTGHGRARVAGAYATPDDGRLTTLGYAALAQVPANGLFDYCWVEIWPPDPATAALARAAVAAERVSDVDVSVGQLNPTHGDHLDALALYQERPTRFAPVAAVAAGLLLGLVGVRLRRLEIASAMHAGVTRRALRAQLGIETSVW